MAGIVNAGFATPSDGVDFFFVFSGMQIGPYQLAGNLVLAPMAGVTDLVFRRICRSFGADGAVSEMVSAKALCFGDRKSRKLCEIDDLERPTGIQLFGHEPHTLAQAAQIVCAFSPDWIDLNMGCPVHKVVSSGDGSALMRDPELIFRIVQAVTQAVELPV